MGWLNLAARAVWFFITVVALHGGSLLLSVSTRETVELSSMLSRTIFSDDFHTLFVPKVHISCAFPGEKRYAFNAVDQRKTHLIASLRLVRCIAKKRVKLLDFYALG